MLRSQHRTRSVIAPNSTIFFCASAWVIASEWETINPKRRKFVRKRWRFNELPLLVSSSGHDAYEILFNVLRALSIEYFSCAVLLSSNEQSLTILTIGR